MQEAWDAVVLDVAEAFVSAGVGVAEAFSVLVAEFFGSSYELRNFGRYLRVQGRTSSQEPRGVAMLCSHKGRMGVFERAVPVLLHGPTSWA